MHPRRAARVGCGVPRLEGFCVRSLRCMGALSVAERDGAVAHGGRAQIVSCRDSDRALPALDSELAQSQSTDSVRALG